MIYKLTDYGWKNYNLGNLTTEQASRLLENTGVLLKSMLALKETPEVKRCKTIQIKDKNTREFTCEYKVPEQETNT